MSKSKKVPAKSESESSSVKGAEKLRDLEVKDAGDVQGGRVALQTIKFTKHYDKSSP